MPRNEPPGFLWGLGIPVRLHQAGTGAGMTAALPEEEA